MKETNGLIYVALLVIVLMGGVILAQHGMMAEQVPSDLPPCGFSTVMSFEGQPHYGYWVELGEGGQKECIIRADNRTVVVQM
jgi:hypothetical protein